MFAQVKSVNYLSDITLSDNQSKYLVNQVVKQMDRFYNHGDRRRMVLNAFTGSGKTTVAVKELIPKVVKKFGKRVIGFIAPLSEVVESSYELAKTALNNKKIDGKVVRVYDSKAIDSVKKEILEGKQPTNLDGDVVFVFLTAQYFYYNYDLLTASDSFDMMIVDEAHIMFGTIDKEDTKADKGVYDKNFNARTLGKLSAMENCAVLFLTATPTNSQQMLTELGSENNVYLNPMPRAVLTTPFFDIKPYIDKEDTVFKGMDFFKDQCDLIAKIMMDITADTWSKASKNFFATYPVLLIRIGRRGATNGLPFDEYVEEIRSKCEQNGFLLFISTSNGKEFNGTKLKKMAEGVRIASKVDNAPVVILTIDSGYAGMDYVKINNVIIGREPSTEIHNNWSQTAGRAARMKFLFRDHEQAAHTIASYDITDQQKRLLVEYYVLHSTSTVHVPVDSYVLNNDVKDFIESDTYRSYTGHEYMLNNVFGADSIPVLKTSTSLEDDSYKRYRKDHCEFCKTASNGKTTCFNNAWKGFMKATGTLLSQTEMNMLWQKCLQVHHADGNHFNNVPSNLKTICPNVHALITIKNEDYNNRYNDLRESLKTLSQKKRGTHNPYLVDLCLI